MMRKKNVQFQMINDQTKTQFESTGTYDSTQLTFVDQEGQKNSVLFKEDKVEYIKTGEKFMHYTFDLKRTTKGIYKIEQFEFVFQIQTTVMDITEEQLKINFTLQQDDEIVGHHQLSIMYKDDKED